MPLPPRDFRLIGPREGQRFPDVRLPDQDGTLVDLHAARASRPALVVFYRSAEWWPFCKTQLVQLQQVTPEVAAAGIALFAISYDSVAILRDFAAAHGITFPLLSDEGSHVMRGLGLINERVQEDHAAYGIPPNPRHVNLPYPGVFVLDAAGVVTRKVFHESYRERDSGGGLVAQAIGLFTTSPKAATAAGPVVTVRAWLDSPTYAWFQRLTLTVEVTVAPGHHVYGQPAAAGLVPLVVEIEPLAGLEVDSVTWPEPHRLVLPGLGDEMWVHDGTVRGTLALTFTGAPGGGSHAIGIRVAFQACSATACLIPSAVRLEVPVREVALVGRSLPTAAAKT